MSDDQVPVRRARLTEQEGCALLKARFEAAGFAITEHHPFLEHGVEITLDGFDADERVGYEFVTTDAGDREELTPEVLAKLEGALRAGDLALLLIDEADVDAARLDFAIEQFLQRIQARRA